MRTWTVGVVMILGVFLSVDSDLLARQPPSGSGAAGAAQQPASPAAEAFAAEMSGELDQLLADETIVDNVVAEGQLRHLEAAGHNRASVRNVVFAYLFADRLERSVGDLQASMDALRGECGPPFHALWRQRLGMLDARVSLSWLNSCPPENRNHFILRDLCLIQVAKMAEKSYSYGDPAGARALPAAFE